MNTKQELQKLKSKLDKASHKLDAAKKRGDQVMMLKFKAEMKSLTKQIGKAENKNNAEVSDKCKTIQALHFSREITKEEQADMGKLKKSVRGLIVVHPLTALGRELTISKVMGFAPKEF